MVLALTKLLIRHLFISPRREAARTLPTTMKHLESHSLAACVDDLMLSLVTGKEVYYLSFPRFCRICGNGVQFLMKCARLLKCGLSHSFSSRDVK